MPLHTRSAQFCALATLLVAALAHAQGPEAPSDLESQNTEVAELYMAGNYAEGEAKARLYLEQWEETTGSDSPEYCSMFSNLGPLMSMQGKLEEAETAYRQAIDCTRETAGPESEDLASALNNYGSHLGKMADFRRAELALEESIRLLRLTLGEDHAYVAITLNNLGVNQQNQGNLVAGEATMREALANLRTALGDDSPTTATAANNLGRLLAKRGAFEEAEPLLREALETREELLGEGHRDTSIGRRDLGRLMRRKGELDKAEEHFRAALQSFTEALGAEHPDVAMSHHELARALADQKRWSEAREHLETSLTLYEAKYEPGHSAHVQLQTEIGEIAFARGDVREARSWFARATQSFETGRERSGEGLDRATYLDTPWTALAVAALESGDEVAAWDAMERGQARVLAEMLGLADDLPKRRDIQSAVQKDQALLGWIDLELQGEERSWLWVLRRDGVRWHRLPKQNAQTMAAFRRGVASPGNMRGLRNAAKQLWRDRLDLASESLERVEHLIVVPSGDMLGVPVDALVDAQGDWVADRWRITYAPSAGLYVAMQQKERPRPERALFVGDPPFSDTPVDLAAYESPSDEVVRGVAHGQREAIEALPPLPGTRSEVLQLSKLWPASTVLLGQQASEPRVAGLAQSDSLRQFGVLHFATHALVDVEDAEASTLVLAQTQLPDALDVLATGEPLVDGLVTTAEILEQWNLDADLVTLSACHSALGRRVTGEGYVGFAHAFLQAGARSTLVSLWGLPDKATSIFMTHFYQQWHREGLSRAEALASAKKALRSHEDEDGRRPYDHPYYWAPFVLMGDAR